jgi:hypothetical protein
LLFTGIAFAHLLIRPFGGFVKISSLLVIFTLAVTVAACGGGGGGSSGGGGGEKPKRTESEQIRLMQKDVAKLKVTEKYYLELYDRFANDSVKKVFGGQTGAALTNFFETRIKHSYTEEELEDATLNVSSFKYRGWDQNISSALDQESKAVTGASNIGTSLWLRGAVENVPLVLSVLGLNIPIDSTRVGIMMFGPGYFEFATLKKTGKEVVVPSEYRNMILLHEARHSDCTGGTTQSDLQIIRDAKNFKEFLAKYKKIKCGHLHALCPQNHELRDITACDEQPWGAYSVGAIYGAAVAAGLSGTDRDIIDASVIDQTGRVTLSFKSMLDGLYGEPDMSHTSVVGAQ